MIRLKTKEIRAAAEGAAKLAVSSPALAPAQAAEPPVERAAGRAVAVLESAAAKESAWRVLPLDGVFELAYRDAAGHPSLRRVSAVELKVGPGKLLLGGVDGQIDAYRGFRVDRIHSLRALDSGETVGRNILDWLMDRAEKQERARARAEAPPRGARQPEEARAG